MLVAYTANKLLGFVDTWAPGQQVAAAVCRDDTKLINAIFGISPWYACLPRDAEGNPVLTSLNDIFLIIFPLVESLVKVAALVAIAYIFFMFFKLMVARGDSGKIATAAQGIRDAVIGLIIALIAVAIVNFVAGAFDASNAGVLSQ